MSGIEIPNGSVAEVKVVWSFGVLAGSTNLASTLISQVGSELVYDGLVINNYDAGNLNFFFDGNMPATLNILNQSGQELDESDMMAQVADAVSSAGGTQVSFAVTKLTGPQGGVNTGTGQTQSTPSGIAIQASTPTPSGSGAHQCGDPSWAWYTDIPQAVNCATNKLLSTIGILFIGLIIGVVLIVAGEKKAGV